MRARVEIVIRDEAGNILSQLAPHEIDLKNQSLHEIDSSSRKLETAGTARNRGKLVNPGSKPVHSRDKKTSSPVVTAQD